MWKIQTVNQRVSGSSPEGGAKKVKGLYSNSITLFYLYFVPIKKST